MVESGKEMEMVTRPCIAGRRRRSRLRWKGAVILWGE